MMTSEEFVTWIDVLTSQPAWCRTPRQWQPRGIKLRLIPPAEWDDPAIQVDFPLDGLQVERLPFDAEPF